MKYKTLDDFNFENKLVLLRSDLNSEIKGNKVLVSDRIIESAKTISELKKKGARVVVLAHQSNPGKKDFVSLKGHCELVNKYTKIKFVSDVVGKRAIREIDSLRNGEAILLENIRFLKDEFKPSKKNKIVKVLGNKGDIYINDAFSVSHREHTSIVSFPKIMKSGIGRVMENELKNIEKVNKGNGLFILGGNKIEDIVLLVDGKRKILSSGTFCLLCLIASGKKLGLENKILRKEMKFSRKIRRNLRNIILPVDLAVLDKGKRKDLELGQFPKNQRVLDLGRESIKLYEKEIMKAKSIFWKGTAGNCGVPGFCEGTKRLLKAMEKSKGYCVVAGGHSSSYVKKFKINKKKLGYVSLSGGALVHYIAGKKLPGLEALKRGI